MCLKWIEMFEYSRHVAISSLKRNEAKHILNTSHVCCCWDVLLRRSKRLVCYYCCNVDIHFESHIVKHVAMFGLKCKHELNVSNQVVLCRAPRAILLDTLADMLQRKGSNRSWNFHWICFGLRRRSTNIWKSSFRSRAGALGFS